jgi:hypothetical protein
LNRAAIERPEGIELLNGEAIEPRTLFSPLSLPRLFPLPLHFERPKGIELLNGEAIEPRTLFSPLRSLAILNARRALNL